MACIQVRLVSPRKSRPLDQKKQEGIELAEAPPCPGLCAPKPERYPGREGWPFLFYSSAPAPGSSTYSVLSQCLLNELMSVWLNGNQQILSKGPESQ